MRHGFSSERDPHKLCGVKSSNASVHAQPFAHRFFMHFPTVPEYSLILQCPIHQPFTEWSDPVIIKLRRNYMIRLIM